MARTVTDAAIVFGALEGAAPDPNDPATSRCKPPANRDYTQFLKRDGLKGARVGIPRAYYYEKTTAPGEKEPWGGLSPEQLKVMTDAIDVLRREGAVVVDPANIPSVVDADEKNNLLKWGICTDMAEVKDRKCSIVFAYGMERDFNAWLKSLGDKAPVKSLTELREWNEARQKMGAIRYGQSLLDVSNYMDLEVYEDRYEHDRANDLRLTAAHGIDEVMAAEKLDAILFPAGWGASVAARPGYPTVTVPFGTVPNAPKDAYPEGFNASATPFGVSFTGMACSEPTLLKLAYAFEQATKKRVPPPAFP
jgi:amidase